MMEGGPGLRLRSQEELPRQQVKRGTVRRIIPYALRYRWALLVLIFATAIDSAVTVAYPLILGLIIDDAVLPHKVSVLIDLTVLAAGLALLDALASYVGTWCSARVGQGLIFSLRNQVFKHVQQQSLAFFTRSQTGSLVSRLNGDVMGAQQAVTSLLTQVVSITLTLFLSLIAMFFLSWQITLIALAVIPMFVIPGKLIGKKLQRLARQQMQLTAEVGSLMNERFNVAGAMLSKLYGRPDSEADLFFKPGWPGPRHLRYDQRVLEGVLYRHHPARHADYHAGVRLGRQPRHFRRAQDRHDRGPGRPDLQAVRPDQSADDHASQLPYDAGKFRSHI